MVFFKGFMGSHGFTWIQGKHKLGARGYMDQVLRGIGKLWCLYGYMDQGLRGIVKLRCLWGYVV